MKRASIFFSLIAGLSLMLTACQEDNEETTFPDNQSNVDNVTAEATFDASQSVEQQAMEVYALQINSSSTENFTESFTAYNDENCATITIYRNETPKRIEIDFGTEGCQGIDGRVRKGIVNITYTGFYRTPGTVITTTFQSHYVDDVLVQGTKTVTNTTEEGGNITHEIVVSDASLTFTDNTTITWQSNRTREWTEGSSTLLNISDDVHQVTGNYSGVNRNGNIFTANITQALEAKVACWLLGFFRPSSGEITYNPTSEFPLVVNFGTGDCDNTYTVTFNGNTYTINE